MSEVISFRMDKNNPREAKALEILYTWAEKGFSTRLVLTKALLEMKPNDPDSKMRGDDHGLDLVIEQIEQVLEIVKSIKVNTSPKHDLDPQQLSLNKHFIESIRQGIKIGIKSE